MKKLILVIVSLISINCFAEIKLKLESIGMGKLLHLNGNVILPKAYKLNKAAPSKIAVYEKIDNEWIQTQRMNLSEQGGLFDKFDFLYPVRLKSNNSEIKIEASLYHCPKLGKGICVIDEYAGLIERNEKKITSEVKLSLVGSNP